MKIALLRGADPTGLTARTAAAVALSSLANGDAPAKSWIQVAKAGQFKNRVVGGKLKTLVITEAMLSEMHENFSTGKHPEGSTQLMVDYEHLSADPKSPADGEAAGWYLKTELREDGTELWAEIEWTADAAEKIASKKFRYFSPEFAFDYTTHAGESIGCTLLCGALTNRPFLQDMDPVELRAGVGDVLASDLSHQQIRVFVQRALSAWWKAKTPTCDPCYGPWICDLYDDYVVFETNDARKFWVDYTIDGIVATIVGDEEEVVVTYDAPAGAAALRARNPGGPMKTTETLKLRTTDGKDVEIAAESLAPHIESSKVVTDLRAELAARPTKEAHDAQTAEIATLTGRIGTLEDESKANKAKLAERDAKEAVDVLIAAGRATPGQRASLTKLYLSNKELFDETTAAMTAKVAPAAGEVGHGGSGGGPDAQTAVAEVRTKVAALRAADATLSEQAATDKVFATDSALYARYVKETEQRVK